MKKVIFIIFIFTIIYSCSKTESNPSVPSVGLLKIGQQYQGGIIAYFLQPGDPGYDANKQHGIITATTDQSAGIRWYNGVYIVTDAYGTELGTGLTNTEKIIAKQGNSSTSYAAGLARAYNGGGYKDWFLPSKDELMKLYQNRVAVGGFANSLYWCSTDYNGLSSIALNHNFLDGVQGTSLKNATLYVRAIRTF